MTWYIVLGSGCGFAALMIQAGKCGVTWLKARELDRLIAKQEAEFAACEFRPAASLAFMTGRDPLRASLRFPEYAKPVRGPLKESGLSQEFRSGPTDQRKTDDFR